MPIKIFLVLDPGMENVIVTKSISGPDIRRLSQEKGQGRGPGNGCLG